MEARKAAISATFPSRSASAGIYALTFLTGESSTVSREKVSTERFSMLTPPPENSTRNSERRSTMAAGTSQATSAQRVLFIVGHCSLQGMVLAPANVAKYKGNGNKNLDKRGKLGCNSH